MLFQKKCPFCQCTLIKDDIDYNFDGCQNELSYCEYCDITFEFKIRYFKVCNKFVYSKTNEEKWYTGYLSDFKEDK